MKNETASAVDGAAGGPTPAPVKPAKSVEIQSITVTHTGPKTDTVHVKTLKFKGGDSVTLTKRDLPQDFPFSISQLVEKLTGIPNLEVKVNADMD